MRNLVNLFWITVFMLSGCAKEEPACCIIPQPQSVEVSEGNLTLFKPLLFISDLIGYEGD